MGGRRMWPSLLATGLLASVANAAPACLLKGPAFPIPTGLASHPVIQAAGRNLTAAFAALSLNETNAVPNNNSWSLEAWSVHDEGAMWSHYHTALNMGKINTTGTMDVDDTSVYRLGSLTKVFTILTWLVEVGDIHWTTPITQFIPELKDIQARTDQSDPVRYMDWDSITVGALMGQVSGIPRDYALLGEMTQDYGPNMVYLGFPPPDKLPETQPCGVWVLCNRTEFFRGLEDLMPSFPPDQSGAYSNVAYILVAFALENMTGKTWETLLRKNVLEPLDLQHTFYSTPNDTSIGVIPGNATTVGWNNQLGDEGPAGSMFSSSRDCTRLGKAILGSKLIPKEMTDRWLRPVVFTSDPAAALGTPWGVRRINMGNRYHWIFGYQKAGRIGDYSALMIMLPDYDIGFTLLTGGQMPNNMNFDFADTMGAFLIPAVDYVAREQARTMYEGDYVHPNSSLNSSITITVDDQPGLNVARWISNGTDMQLISVLLMLKSQGPVTPRVRLYPTGLETVYKDGSKKVAFKATFEDTGSEERWGRLFSTDCATWLTASSLTWAARSLDEFVFHIDAKGKVISVDPVALRNPLDKRDGPPTRIAPPAQGTPPQPSSSTSGTSSSVPPSTAAPSPSPSPSVPGGGSSMPGEQDGGDWLADWLGDYTPPSAAGL